MTGGIPVNIDLESIEADGEKVGEAFGGWGIFVVLVCKARP